MDILRPQLLWIGKRCYRVNPMANATQPQVPKNEYIEEDMYDAEDDTEQEYEVDDLGQSRYRTSFHVPSAFFGRIIGGKGATKKRIEGETKTEIIIPKHGKIDDIKIMGTSRDSVCVARRRIEMIVSGSRNKERPTHFLCVRVTNEPIRKNYIKFKEDVTKMQPILGLKDSMFTDPDKLHITLTVMCLMDDIERTLATELLNKCREEIILSIKNTYGSIKVNVRGIEIMNDDPSSVRVLYAKIESESLQSLADGVLRQFVHSGLSKREFDRDTVKLHMTLINSKNDDDDEDDGDGNGAKKNKRIVSKFDARNILENLANNEFGTFDVTEIRLAIMKTKDTTTGFYKSTASIEF